MVHNGVLDPGTEFIAKPYTGQALANKVRSVLDGQRMPPDCDPFASSEDERP